MVLHRRHINRDATRLRLHKRKTVDSFEVAVAADQRCVYGKGSRRDPEVVLIQRQTEALL